jgi:ABC-type Fe3+ transport system substrate-binding protein
MDRRALIGVVLIVVIGAGALYMFSKPQTPPSNGDGPPSGQALISGTVKDDSGNLLEGVLIKSGSVSVSTGSDGSFELEVDLGSYVVEASKTDYAKGVKSVSVTESVTYTADFTLKYDPASGGEGKTLKIITRHGADILLAAKNNFLASDYAAAHGITAIRWIPIGPTLWVDTIRNSDDIDIGWGGGPVLFDVVNEAGFLAPLETEGILAALEEIPSIMGGVPTRRTIDDTVYWSGSAVASFGFTVNTQTLADLGLPEPTSWSDLANETYAVTLPDPIVGTADATKSTSNTRMFTIILQAYGWQDGWSLLVRKGANSRIYDQSGLVRDAAIQGTIGVGTTIDFYGYTAQLKNPEFCKYVLPADGTIVNADPIALLTTSTDPDGALAFIEWILSTEGQKIWLDTNINSRHPRGAGTVRSERGLRDDSRHPHRGVQ